jgi:hypothetical protein
VRSYACAFVFGLPWIAACAASQPRELSASAEPTAAIAGVHAHACARCHRPPEPRLLTRDQLENVFVRHRTRVRLSADQWDRLVDYLAQGDSR